MSLYALLTRHCNLSCPHCNVKYPVEEFNEDKFIDQLRLYNNGTIIFFGGEPTLYQDRLLRVANDEIIKTKKRSITTNLINLNDDLINLYHDIGSVATSWNPNRFDSEQYRIWLKHLDWLHNENIDPLVMVTLTKDLISMDAYDFLCIMHEWNIKSIRFETYVGNDTDPKFWEDVDNWLCDVYRKWDSPIKNKIIDNVKRWYYECKDVYTLHPEGNITTGCPHRASIQIPDECYTCERVSICKPCRLQKYCSYPRKFAKLLTDN